MDKDTTKTTFYQYLEPINFGNLAEILLSLDKYVKKLSTEKLIMILIYGQLFSKTSLTELSTEVKNDEELQKILKLESISTSQLSRKLRDIPDEVLQAIFKDLKIRILAKRGVNFARKAFKYLNIIDSSTVSMAVSQYPWAEFRNTKAGIKVHTRIVFDNENNSVTPDKIVITSAKGADKTKMDDLVVTTAKDALHVFDRAYVDYEKFDEYCENDTIFLSRLKSNAKIEIISTETKIIDGKEVTDSIVRLGENTTRMTNNLRLLEIPDDKEPGKIIRIITNDFTRSTQEISDFYRNRWQIELFFKWIKQHLHVKKFYGISQNAVKNQILSAMVTYLLLCLFKKKVNSHWTLLDTLCLISICRYQSLEKFIEKLKRPPTRTSKGRRKINHEEIFNLTYRQVMSGDTELLNSTEIDPVIL